MGRKVEMGKETRKKGAVVEERGMIEEREMMEEREVMEGVRMVKEGVMVDKETHRWLGPKLESFPPVLNDALYGTRMREPNTKARSKSKLVMSGRWDELPVTEG